MIVLTTAFYIYFLILIYAFKVLEIDRCYSLIICSIVCIFYNLYVINDSFNYLKYLIIYLVFTSNLVVQSLEVYIVLSQKLKIRYTMIQTLYNMSLVCVYLQQFFYLLQIWRLFCPAHSCIIFEIFHMCMAPLNN